MAVGSKYNTIAIANNIGQFRTDHNLIVEEINRFSNTTGINHGTLSILSVKGTANVTANATFSGQNTSVTGTFTVGGSRVATNTQLQSIRHGGHTQAFRPVQQCWPQRCGCS